MTISSCMEQYWRMPGDHFPFPVHDRPTVATTDEQARAYERTLALLLTEWIAEQGGEAHGHSGVLLSVHLEGCRPETSLVLRYRSHAGGEYDVSFSIWDEELLDTGAEPPSYESPAGYGGMVVADWDEGSIRSHDDPYGVAVERQRRVVTEWRQAFPEAAAARPHSVGDRAPAPAAWRQWHERFPEASAAWGRIGPVEDHL